MIKFMMYKTQVVKNGFELHIILEKDANPNAVLQTLFERTGFTDNNKD